MQTDLDPIEARAFELRVTLKELREKAGVAYTSYFRVANGSARKLAKTRLLRKLESTLDAIETERAAAMLSNPQEVPA